MCLAQNSLTRQHQVLTGQFVRTYAVKSCLKIRTINATALISTEFINQGKFKCTIVGTGWLQGRNVHIVAETQAELVIIETSRKNHSISENSGLNFIGNTNPST
jgi:hypothetical protein